MSSPSVFHRIINREIPAEILFEDEEMIAIRDIAPIAPTHILLIPKMDLPDLSMATLQDTALLGRMLFRCARIAEEEGIDKSGYRIVINTGEHGGQTVFQLHIHIIGGRECSWPPG